MSDSRVSFPPASVGQFYRNEDAGAWESGAIGDDADLVRSYFGFCSCGPLDGPFPHVLKCLRMVERGWRRESGESYDEWHALCVEAAGSSDSWDFFLYWADKEELSEHGGGVGGSWLTEKGAELVSVLSGLLEDE